MLDVDIKVIPHKQQRYETVGDWWIDSGGTCHIRVSNMGNWRFEFAVALHELAEWALCRAMNVSQNEVDQFDMAFEARREPGNTDEPGDDVNAPYRTQHCIATAIERIIIGVLGLSWKEYDDAVNAL